MYFDARHLDSGPVLSPTCKRLDKDEILSAFSLNRELKASSSSSSSRKDGVVEANKDRVESTKRVDADAFSKSEVQKTVVGLLSSLPSSDHALAYTILSSGVKTHNCSFIIFHFLLLFCDFVPTHRLIIEFLLSFVQIQDGCSRSGHIRVGTVRHLPLAGT